MTKKQRCELVGRHHTETEFFLVSTHDTVETHLYNLYIYTSMHQHLRLCRLLIKGAASMHIHNCSVDEIFFSTWSPLCCCMFFKERG